VRVRQPGQVRKEAAITICGGSLGSFFNHFEARRAVIAALPRLPQLARECYEYQIQSREVRTLRNSETADAAASLDLLFASITQPAMLLYLDQAQSVGPGSMVAKRVRKNRNRKIGLNENLAREILERLLGADITPAKHCLWSNRTNPVRARSWAAPMQQAARRRPMRF